MIDESTTKGSISTIFASLSTPIRINIIKSLNEHSQLTFMALLRALNLTPDKDASSLSYHLKVLINSKIITKSSDNKYYLLTSLGKSIANFLGTINIYLTNKIPINVYDYSELTVTSLQESISDLIRNLPLESITRINLINDIHDLLVQTNSTSVSLSTVAYLLFSKLIELGHTPDSVGFLTQLGPHKFSLKDKLIEPQKLYHGEKLGEHIFKAVQLNYVIDYLSPLLRHLLGTKTFFISSEHLLLGPETSYFNTIFLVNGYLKSKIARMQPPSLTAVLNYLINLYYEDSRVRNVVYDDFNLALAPLAQSISYKELKKHFIDFLHLFSGLLTTKTLALNLSLYEGEKIKSYTYHTHTLSLSEYDEEANQISMALIDAYDTISEDIYLSNPYLFLRLSKKTLNILPDNYLATIANSLKDKKGNGVFIVNTTPSWQTEFVAYSAYGQRFKCAKYLEQNLNNAITLGLNVFNLFKEAKGNETLFFDLLDRSLSDIALFLDSLKDVPSYEFKEKILKKLPITYTFPKEQKRLFLVGLNELAHLVTGYYPWKNKLSLKFILKLLTQIEEMLASKLAHQNVSLMATYPFSYHLPYYDTIFKDANTYRIFSTETVNRQTSYESFLKIARYESQIHPKFLGGHYFGIQIQKEISKEKINELLTYLSKTSIGLYSLVRQKTICTNCDSVHIGILDTCPNCSSHNLLYLAPLNAPSRLLSSEYKRLIKIKNLGFLEHNF